MKKIFAILVSLIMAVAVFTACSKTVDETETVSSTATNTSTEIATSAQASEQMETAESYVPQTQTKMVIMSFNAVEGAVIYDQSYDSNGYLESCQFHKKCEACGYVSNNNGQARDNLTTGYYCTECGNNQHVEITADKEWVEVPNEY